MLKQKKIKTPYLLLGFFFLIGLHHAQSQVIAEGFGEEKLPEPNPEFHEFNFRNPHPQEFLIISGGCALRYYEREKERTHDRYWANFINTAAIKLRELAPKMRTGDILTWLVYRPSYIARGKEDKKNYIKMIIEKARKIPPTRLLWFESTSQLVNYMNRGKNRKRYPIGMFHFFGHSNKLALMFDYSLEYDGLSVEILHQEQLKRINPKIFIEEAYCQSWGCHSGESYSSRWRRTLRVPMIGAVGKTDYGYGNLPVISVNSVGGHWKQ